MRSNIWQACSERWKAHPDVGFNVVLSGLQNASCQLCQVHSQSRQTAHSLPMERQILEINTRYEQNHWN